VLEGPPRRHSGPLALIRPDDLPVGLARVVLEPALAEEALVRLRVTQASDGASSSFDVRLDAARPQLVVCIADPESTTFTVEATSVDGETVRSEVLPPHDLVVDRGLFSEFGSHRIDVSTEGLSPSLAIVMELAPERDLSRPTRLTLSAQRPRVEWGYVAMSPFGAGYRVRLVSEGVADEWSSARSPFEPLVLPLPERDDGV
jgi:hypothetical protein